MYLWVNLTQSAAKFGLANPSLIHVGAHTGEEAGLYHYRIKASHVLWIEANPALMNKLRRNIAVFPNQWATNALLSDTDGGEAAFYVANNTQCSSMLPLKEHASVYPDYKYVNEIKLTTKRLDTLLAERGDPPYDILILDVQGAEDMVLSGAPKVLEAAKLVYSECNFKEMYSGCPLVGQLDEQLFKHGFLRRYTFDTGCGWGEAIYEKMQ